MTVAYAGTLSSRLLQTTVVQTDRGQKKTAEEHTAMLAAL